MIPGSGAICHWSVANFHMSFRRTPKPLRAREFPQLIFRRRGLSVRVDGLPGLRQRFGIVDGNAIFEDAGSREPDTFPDRHLLAVRR